MEIMKLKYLIIIVLIAFGPSLRDDDIQIEKGGLR